MYKKKKHYKKEKPELHICYLPNIQQYMFVIMKILISVDEWFKQTFLDLESFVCYVKNSLTSNLLKAKYFGLILEKR